MGMGGWVMNITNTKFHFVFGSSFFLSPQGVRHSSPINPPPCFYARFQIRRPGVRPFPRTRVTLRAGSFAQKKLLPKSFYFKFLDEYFMYFNYLSFLLTLFQVTIEINLVRCK
jgi:hypothetical protein